MHNWLSIAGACLGWGIGGAIRAELKKRRSLREPPVSEGTRHSRLAEQRGELINLGPGEVKRISESRR